MKLSKSLTLLLGAAAMFAMYGCGSDNRESNIDQQSASYQASAACIGCHDNTIYRSPVTGAIIAEEWKASAHNTRNGASCPDCHTTNGHPSGGALANIPGDVVCLNCHTATSMRTYNAHFVGGATYDATKAAYVTPYDANSCRVCHNPHDTTTLLAVNQQWAASGHGDVTKEPWMHYPWRSSSRDACQRCHTAGGFRYYMTGTQGQLVAGTSAIFGKYTTGREALGCKGCHTDYSWKRITPQAAFVTPYTPSLGASNSFPAGTVIGDTQLCIPCHAGLTGGTSVETTTADLKNTNFSAFNSHYMAAAGTMYVKAGFTGFTSASAVLGTSTYGKSLTSTDDGGAVSSTHRKLGTSAIIGDHGITAADGLDAGGPCVTCHMKGGHSLAINGDAFNRVCVKCHDAEGTTTLTASNFKTAFIDPQAEVFENALNLALNILQTKYGVGYNSAAYPYFYDLTLDSTGKTALKDWTRSGTVANPKKLLGACFNINLLKREPAAYVHARTYTRRLVYDTIDFLDDGVMNWSVSATAIAKNSTLYGKGAKAYTTSATVGDVAPGTTESMLYLNGFNRTNGAWSTPERP
ncbi:hypothetical protein [Geobacter benzoatilyticus]|jgi:hypothetical protein|uniref:Uncharacterized protein n=1 Tax=Geobacter benzoatilyticus TaxID=2815309 RepID=A0ABX7Q3Y9_9BACT|nr:hypothetical protein [Geobacter benzoatilyticus]QSV45788.1 hypothetical protein JZM60_00375 [Geobacter benzoatilyticus]